MIVYLLTYVVQQKPTKDIFGVKNEDKKYVL